MATEEPTSVQRKGDKEGMKSKVSSMLRSRQEKMKEREEAEKEKYKKQGEAKEAAFRKDLAEKAAETNAKPGKMYSYVDAQERIAAGKEEPESYPGEQRQKTLEDAADTALMQKEKEAIAARGKAFRESLQPSGKKMTAEELGYDPSAFEQEDDSLEVEGGYTSPDLTARAAAIESAAESAITADEVDKFMSTRSQWQGQGGYNFTYVPPETPEGQGKIIVEAPIGREGSSMKEGTTAVVTPDSKNEAGQSLFNAILQERLGGGEVKEYKAAPATAGRGKPAPPPPPPPAPANQDDAPVPMVDTVDYTTSSGAPEPALVFTDSEEDQAPEPTDLADDQAPAADDAVADAVSEMDTGVVQESSMDEPASSEAELAGEADRATLREDYQGGDPTPDEIRDALSQLSPGVREAKQKYIIKQAEQKLAPLEARVKEAASNLEKARIITEQTGETAQQTEAEKILAREQAALSEALREYNALMSPERAAEVDSTAYNPRDLSDPTQGFLSPGVGGR